VVEIVGDRMLLDVGKDMVGRAGRVQLFRVSEAEEFRRKPDLDERVVGSGDTPRDTLGQQSVTALADGKVVVVVAVVD